MGAGNLIWARRTALGWSQQVLADELNRAAGRATLGRAEVSRWERGQVTPGMFWLPVVAGVLGIPIQDLRLAARAPSAPGTGQSLVLADHAARRSPVGTEPDSAGPESGDAAGVHHTARFQSFWAAPAASVIIGMAEESGVLGQRAGSTNVHPTNLDEMDDQVRRLATGYLTEPMIPLMFPIASTA